MIWSQRQSQARLARCGALLSLRPTSILANSTGLADFTCELAAIISSNSLSVSSDLPPRTRSRTSSAISGCPEEI